MDNTDNKRNRSGADQPSVDRSSSINRGNRSDSSSSWNESSETPSRQHEGGRGRSESIGERSGSVGNTNRSDSGRSDSSSNLDSDFDKGSDRL